MIPELLKKTRDGVAGARAGQCLRAPAPSSPASAGTQLPCGQLRKVWPPLPLRGPYP